MFEINNEELSFWTVVCNTPVQVSPTILSKIFGVPYPPTPLAYPIHRLTLEQKGGMVQNLCNKFVSWPDRLPHKQCRAIVQVLHWIFIYNILPITNRSVLTNNTAYLIDGILNNEQIDLLAILCHTMIKTYEAAHSTGSLPYPTIITQLLQATKVPFKVVPRGCKVCKAVGHDTLRKMGLIDKAIGLIARPSRAYTITTCTSMMTLLHTLVWKVSKVLKNHKTLASNQK